MKLLERLSEVISKSKAMLQSLMSHVVSPVGPLLIA
jgi:hypothetical protein